MHTRVCGGSAASLHHPLPPTPTHAHARPPAPPAYARLPARASLQDAPGAFLDQPLADTLFTLVAAGAAGSGGGGDTKKTVAALVKDFRVPETQYYHVKIRALASQRDWAGLTAFSNERSKPPVGLAPFVDACAGQGAALEAKKYALRLPDYEERVERLVSLGAFTEAAEAAVKAKDVPRLQSIMEGAPTAAAKDICEKALVGMGVLEAAVSRNPAKR